MKGKIMMALGLFMLAISVNAQKIQLGAKAGATLNKISGKTFSDQFSFGYHAGGFLSIGIGKKWGIQTEVLFNQVNIDTSSHFSDIYKFNKLNNIQLKYLSIPVLLNYNAGRLITFQAGPQFGILMNKSNTLFQNGRNAFRNGDLAMLGGLQLNIAMLKIYGRYSIGLNNINDIDKTDKWKSQGIQLGIGLKL